MSKLEGLIKECINFECSAKGIIRSGNTHKKYGFKQMETNTEVLMLYIKNCNRVSLDQVRKIVINNIWTDICLEIVEQQRAYFVEYFTSRESEIKRLLIDNMYDIFIEINSSNENEYMEYKELDIDILPNGRSLITNNWRDRNLYCCIKELVPDIATEIVSEAKVIYKQYVMDLEKIDKMDDNLLQKFKGLQTERGRMKFLDNKIWSKASLIRISGQETLDISSLLKLTRDIIILLNYSLSIRDFIVSVDILDIIIFIIGNYEGDSKLRIEIRLMQKSAVNEIKSFLYNKQIKQVYDILICL